MVKRIIAGKAYNTETATKIAIQPQNNQDFDSYNHFYFTHLYKTRQNTYFLHHGHQFHPGEDDLTPLSPEETIAWLQKYAISPKTEEILKNPTHAVDAGGESRFTLRLPDSLKKQIDIAANANRQSTNAWILRCVEKILNE